MSSVTVVIPTCDRPEGLRRLLDAIDAQASDGLELEVVVVDNGAGGSEADRSAELAARVRWPVRVVHEPRRGASHARNRGIEEVASDLTVFVDDDVVPEPGWLTALVRPLCNGTYDGVGGRVVLDRSVSRPVWLYDGALGYLAELDLGPETRPLDADEFLITASAAFRTDVLRASGGFDPSLGPRPDSHIVNDDVLLGRRVVRAGGRLGYVGEAVVVHELPASRMRLSWMLKRLYAQGRSDWLLERVDAAPLPWEGAAEVARTVGYELVTRGRQGLWHRPVAFRFAGEVVRAVGFWREAAAASFRGARRA